MTLGLFTVCNGDDVSVTVSDGDVMSITVSDGDVVSYCVVCVMLMLCLFVIPVTLSVMAGVQINFLLHRPAGPVTQ